MGGRYFILAKPSTPCFVPGSSISDVRFFYFLFLADLVYLDIRF